MYRVRFGFDDISYDGTQRFWRYRSAEKRRQLYLAQGYTWSHVVRLWDGQIMMKDIR